MSDDDLIEQIARAICIARGDDPDSSVIHPYYSARVAPLALTPSGLFFLAPRSEAVCPAWTAAVPEARAAFVCIRDLRGLKDETP